MKSRKNRKYSRKNRKGGFFFSKPKVVSSVECDVNTLPTLTKMPDVNDTSGQLKPLDERISDLDNMTYNLRENYNKCCPKGFMGSKNTSPYCKQLDTTFKSIQQHKHDISGYYGDETDVAKIKQVMNAPMVAPGGQYEEPKKAWYKFWGGKKTRKHRKHSHQKRSHRRK